MGTSLSDLNFMPKREQLIKCSFDKWERWTGAFYSTTIGEFMCVHVIYHCLCPFPSSILYRGQEETWTAGWLVSTELFYTFSLCNNRNIFCFFLKPSLTSILTVCSKIEGLPWARWVLWLAQILLLRSQLLEKKINGGPGWEGNPWQPGYDVLQAGPPWELCVQNIRECLRSQGLPEVVWADLRS